MEPAVGIEPTTYRLQGGCSTYWAKLAQSPILDLDLYFFKASNAFEILDFFLEAFLFLITPTFAALSIAL